MKIAMYFLPWKMPKVMEGEHAICKVGDILKDEQINKVLIVTGTSLVGRGLLDDLFETLNQSKIEFALFNQVTPDPSEILVEKGRTMYLHEKCNGIIALGGGSPMDCAKAIGARIVRPQKKIAQLQGLLKVRKKLPLLIAIPTTAGTGSETTIAAVITESQSHHKAAITDPCLMPSYAILEPSLTVGLSPKTSGACGMDALCHALEAYLNHTYNTKVENKCCSDAIVTIHESLPKVLSQPTDLQARSDMLKASFDAGRAFTRGCVGYVHALGHAIGSIYHVSHGEMMGILLPHVLLAYGKTIEKPLADLCERCNMMQKGSNEAKAHTFIEWIKTMKQEIGLPEFPPLLEKDIPLIVQLAYKEANPLYPVPVYWKKKDFVLFLESMIEMTEKNN